MRRRERGSATIEYLIMLAFIGIGVSGVLVKAESDMFQEFQTDRRAIASPFP